MSQPAGWYPNQQGQMQYWDGNAWGQVQQQAAMPQPAAATAGAGYAPAPAYGYAGAQQMPAVLANTQLAGWGVRFGAALLDGLFVLFTIGIGFVVNFFLMAREGEKNGMTLGKQVCNIRVVKEDGTPVDIGFALLRDLLIKTILIGWIGGFFLIPVVANYLWPLWDERNQALHDKMAKSYVVKS